MLAATSLLLISYEKLFYVSSNFLEAVSVSADHNEQYIDNLISML